MTGAPTRLHSERLLLRELGEQDAPFVLELLNEADFLTFIGDKGVRTLDDARRFLREGAWTTQSLAGHGQLLVEARDDGRPLGVCGLLHRPGLGLSDVGFAFLERHRGQGYASEAARAVLTYGTTQLGLPHVYGLTSPDNAASIRVLETLGLRFSRLIQMGEDGPPTALYA